MNELEKKHYARHLAAFEQDTPSDVKHWKYISKKRGPNGKWQYTYKESEKSNKLTGKTDHEYTKNELTDKDIAKKSAGSYELIDETTKVRCTYDAETGEFKFDFADGYVDENAQYSGPKPNATGSTNTHEYTYTRDGKQYKTTVNVANGTNAATIGVGNLGMKTRDLTSDTVVEKAADKIKNWFKKK